MKTNAVGTGLAPSATYGMAMRSMMGTALRCWWHHVALHSVPWPSVPFPFRGFRGLPCFGDSALLYNTPAFAEIPLTMEYVYVVHTHPRR
jgi:hypothetical protein